MERKKIVMFYKKERVFTNHPFEKELEKKNVYHYFFEQGSALGFDMYLVAGINKYLGALSFSRPLFFNKNNGSFEVIDGTIRADAIIDRSGGLSFPPEEIKEKVLDNLAFKKICWNKSLMYNYLKGYCPTSYLIKSATELKKNLRLFNAETPVVLKPSAGLKGIGVTIGFPAQIASLKDIDYRQNWILQEFIDTSRGIKRLVAGYHDLRVVIVNGKIIFSHIRQPKLGNKIANVAQGGSIKELALEDIPESVLRITKKLQKKIDTNFDKPLYSIDFGLCDKKAFVFEINDTIGFPSEKMSCYRLFINEVLSALKKRAARKYAF